MAIMEINIQHKLLTSDGYTSLLVKETIPEGSFVAVFGKSGIGKTSLFNIIAGFLKPDAGYVKTKDKVLVDRAKNLFLPAQKRDVALMFQNYALFPNMTVRQNIAFAQKEKNDQAISDLIARFDLKTLEHQLPSKLSGGQQQRVALARTLAQKASIVLLDEPLSAVDAAMRQIMKQEIARFHQQHKATVFVISHNEEEFADLSDVCVRMF